MKTCMFFLLVFVSACGTISESYLRADEARYNTVKTVHGPDVLEYWDKTMTDREAFAQRVAAYNRFMEAWRLHLEEQKK